MIFQFPLNSICTAKRLRGQSGSYSPLQCFKFTSWVSAPDWKLRSS